jgi:16S rRNA (uracil1498-N3)-methyltransferase
VTHRFYAPEARERGDLIKLSPDEAQHLKLVLRLSTGAQVRVFDGRGHEFEATVEDPGRGGVAVRIQGPHEAAPEPRVAITLVQAVLKGDKMDDVVRDAVMMGASTIQPIVTSRTEISTAAMRRAGRTERWQRVAVASAKQCGRAVVPRILDPITFEDTMTALAQSTLPAPAIMLVEPGATSEVSRLADLVGDDTKEATMVIGPEGGWSKDEIALGSTSCWLVTLGGRTLRADAVPVVALSVLFAMWKEF